MSALSVLFSSTMSHPRGGCVRQYKNKGSRLVIHPRHKTRVIRTKRKKYRGKHTYLVQKKQTEDQTEKKTIKQRRTKFEPTAAVGGTSIIDMFHLLLLIVGLVPCYPDCRLLPTFVHRGFPHTPPLVAPLPPSPWSGFLPLFLLPPLPLFPWALPTADAPCRLLSCASSSCNLTMSHSAALRTPRHRFPACFAAVDHSAVSTPNTKGECPFIFRWLGTP